MMAALRDGLPTQEGQVLIADASTDKDWIAATLQQNAQNAGGQAGTSSTPLVGPKVKPLSEIFGWGKKTEPNATGTSTTSEQKPLWEHPWVKTGGEWIQKGLVKIGVKADKRAEFFNSNGQGLANGMNQVSAYPDQVSGK